MDEEYAKAGATLFEEHTAVFAKADLIVKVKSHSLPNIPC